MLKINTQNQNKWVKSNHIVFIGDATFYGEIENNLYNIYIK